MSEVYSNSEISIDALPRFEQVQFNPVSMRLRSKNMVVVSIPFMLFLVAFLIGFLWLPGSIFLVLAACLLGFIFLIRYVDVWLKQKFYGFAIREKDIIYRRGYIVSKTTVIPFNRIQHSSISRSLLDKWFGLSSLKIYTAGGSGSDMRIPGLIPEQAKGLNEVLSQKVAEHEF